MALSISFVPALVDDEKRVPYAEISVRSLRGSISRKPDTTIAMYYLRGYTTVRPENRARMDDGAEIERCPLQRVPKNRVRSIRVLNDAAVRDWTTRLPDHQPLRKCTLGLHQLSGQRHHRHHSVVRWTQGDRDLSSSFLQCDGDLGPNL